MSLDDCLLPGTNVGYVASIQGTTVYVGYVARRLQATPHAIHVRCKGGGVVHLLCAWVPAQMLQSPATPAYCNFKEDKQMIDEDVGLCWSPTSQVQAPRGGGDALEVLLAMVMYS